MSQRFKFICRLNGGDSHKLFFDNDTDQFAIADNSGRRPDETDDGVLLLDPSRLVKVTNGSMGLRATCPVKSVSGIPYTILTTLHGATTLKKKAGMQVDLSASARATLYDLDLLDEEISA